MNIFKLLIISFLNAYLASCQFVKYITEKNLGIKDKFIASNMLGQQHTVSSDFVCLIECNKNPACRLATLNKDNECALFNDQISLVHTENSTKTTIYSKKKMEMCIEGKKYDEVNHVCYPMKYHGESCAAMIECVQETVICSNKWCTCLDTE